MTDGFESIPAMAGHVRQRLRLRLIAGPCVIESEEHVASGLRERIREIAGRIRLQSVVR